MWLGDSGPVPFQNMSMEKLTSSGKAILATISPDGKYVAYVQHGGTEFSLWIRQTTTASKSRSGISQAFFTTRRSSRTPRPTTSATAKRRISVAASAQQAQNAPPLAATAINPHIRPNVKARPR